MSEIIGGNGQGEAFYYSLFAGKIARRLKEPGEGEGYITRTNMNGKTVHEKHVDGLAGLLQSIEVKEEEGSEYGPQWVITLQSGEQTSILQISYSSRPAQSFLKRLPNVDLEKPVEIRVMPEEKDGKINTVLWISQGGTVPMYYTKDNPNGCPQLEKTEIKGARGKVEVKWSDTEMMLFLEKMVEEKIQPKLKALNGEKSQNKPK
jgi:hypothetical protein